MGANEVPAIRPAESLLVEKKTVTSPYTGWSYVIRPIEAVELYAAAGGLIDLKDLFDPKTKEATERRLADPRQREKVSRAIDRIVRGGLVEPALPDGAPVSCLGVDVLFLYREVQELAGLTREAWERVRPSSPTREDSPSSTSSVGDTPGPRATSSDPG